MDNAVAPSLGVGSIGGSLRRHQSASMQPGEVIQTSVLKGSFGSLSRRNEIPKIQSSKKDDKLEDIAEGEVDIEYQ